MKNRAGGQTNFRPASLTIHDFPGTNEPSFIMATPGTSESFRPSNFLEVLRTGFFGKKFPLKFNQASFFVRFCHFYTPCKEV
jgi:hypothetical protein